MGTTIVWGDIEEKLNKYCKSILSSATSQIADELTKEAASSISDFYNDYTPIYYRRHYYNFERNSFRRYYSNPHNTIYRGGVELTPDRMSDIYQDPTIEVFDLVYSGFHGVASGFVSPNRFSNIPNRMSPSPIERLYAKRDKLIKNINKYVSKAQRKASVILK